VPLPDGRVVWLFGDTFIGALRPDGTRETAHFVNNSVVVQDGAQLTTLHGGSPEAPTSLFPSPAAGDYYWVGDGTVEGGKLRVFLIRFGRTGNGAWDFRFKGSAVATLSLPDLRLESVTPVPGGDRVAWGSALLERGDYTYVYGVEDLQQSKYAHVARAPRGGVTGAWEYFDGVAWSPNPAASARVLDGVSNQYSVVESGAGFVLISQEAGFGRRIRAWRSATPVGPWVPAADLGTVPDPGQGRFTYNAVVHPQAVRDGQLLLSYSVNGTDPAEVQRDASIYRPRFLRVTIPPVG
jgi:hypothetical protein